MEAVMRMRDGAIIQVIIPALDEEAALLLPPSACGNHDFSRAPYAAPSAMKIESIPGARLLEAAYVARRSWDLRPRSYRPTL
jgi:hypothetical protein